MSARLNRCLRSILEFSVSQPAPALNPPVRTLMGPGPSDIHPRVLEALGKVTVGHLDPFYLETMNHLHRFVAAPDR